MLVSALVSVIGLILLIAVLKLNPVITLILAALSLAVVGGVLVQIEMDGRAHWSYRQKEGLSEKGVAETVAGVGLDGLGRAGARNP